MSQVFYVLAHSLVKFGNAWLSLPLLLMARFGVSSLILMGIQAATVARCSMRGDWGRKPHVCSAKPSKQKNFERATPFLSPRGGLGGASPKKSILARQSRARIDIDGTFRNQANIKQLVLRAILGLAAMAFYFYALRIGPLGRGNLIFSLAVLWGYVFSIIGRQETPTLRTSLGMGAALLGLGLLFTIRGENGNLYADLAALAGSLCSGMVMVTLKSLRKTHSSKTIITWFYGVGALLVLPFFSLQNVTFTWPLMGLIVGIGVAGLLAQWIMTDAYKAVPGSVASSMNLLGTPMMMVSGMLFFSETLHMVEMMGAVCIMVGLVAIVWPKRETSK